MPTLSEADSKRLLARHGVTFPPERQVASAPEAAAAARELGHPVVLKLGGAQMAHKTERGLVRLALGDDAAVEAAGTELLAAAHPDDGEVHLLVAPMLSGQRELIAGLHLDAQFGMTVMIGLGGILAEALEDVAFRLVPITRHDAHAMLDDLASQALLGPLRGEPAVDREAVADILMGLSEAAESEASLLSVDLNPLIVVAGTPVAADALVETAP